MPNCNDLFGFELLMSCCNAFAPYPKIVKLHLFRSFFLFWLNIPISWHAFLQTLVGSKLLFPFFLLFRFVVLSPLHVLSSPFLHFSHITHIHPFTQSTNPSIHPLTAQFSFAFTLHLHFGLHYNHIITLKWLYGFLNILV